MLNFEKAPVQPYVFFKTTPISFRFFSSTDLWSHLVLRICSVLPVLPLSIVPSRLCTSTISTFKDFDRNSLRPIVDTAHERCGVKTLHLLATLSRDHRFVSNPTTLRRRIFFAFGILEISQ